MTGFCEMEGTDENKTIRRAVCGMTKSIEEKEVKLVDLNDGRNTRLTAS